MYYNVLSHAAFEESKLGMDKALCHAHVLFDVFLKLNMFKFVIQGTYII